MGEKLLENQKESGKVEVMEEVLQFSKQNERLHFSVTFLSVAFPLSEIFFSF